MRHDEIYREFDRTFGARAHGRFEPNADVYIDEAGERVVVQVEIAGSDPSELRVAIDDRSLMIAGRRTGLGEHRSASILRKRSSSASSSRRFASRCPSTIGVLPPPIATVS